jgi:hypothetical protein
MMFSRRTTGVNHPEPFETASWPSSMKEKLKTMQDLLRSKFNLFPGPSTLLAPTAAEAAGKLIREVCQKA